MKSLAMLLLITACSIGFASPETLRVGIKPTPPFAFQDESGQWVGISVELWDRVARQQDWQTEWLVMENPRAQIAGLTDGTIDMALGALSVTSERELAIDFSHPFYTTGLTIATPTRQDSWLGIAAQLLSPAFLSAVGILVLLLFAVGLLMWVVERKKNTGQFGGSVPEGIGNGFWWSAVTMTTVGYGDKAPITATGRVLATIWMFASVITISGFTAAIASTITLSSLTTSVTGVQDLGRVRPVAVDGSTGEQFLLRNGYGARKVANSADGLTLLRNGEAEALVQDEALLRYLLKDAGTAIEILPITIEKQDYAFGLKPGFEHREALNRALLSIIESDDWHEILNRYLGHR